MRPHLVQARIIHVSDLHFGETHRFQPDRTPDADRPSARGYRSLAQSIRADVESLAGQHRWLSAHDSCPLAVAVTGDLTNTASVAEFEQVKAFLGHLRGEAIAGAIVDESSMFVVPGNHDVIYDEVDPGRRWYPYCEFYQEVFGHTCRPRHAHDLTRVRDFSEQRRLIIAEVNTAFDVRKGSPDEKRGQVAAEDIDRLRDQLSAIPESSLSGSIRIALMHHHPVVLPALAEPGRGYDAVVNSQTLLAVLRDFGFHLVLHGHKHYPHTFSYDPLCAWTLDPALPMVVVSGGSAGCRSLPDADGATNTYNAIAIKWFPEGHQARILVETRGLVRHDERRIPLSPGKWYWRTLRIVDRVIRREPQVRVVVPATREFSEITDAPATSSREHIYKSTRGNMLVAEVYPSLDPDQCYDVRVRIVPHRHDDRVIPMRVEWSCGPNFPKVVTCERGEDEEFSATFSYWDSMLVCATLHFEDGDAKQAHIYAHIPR